MEYKELGYYTYVVTTENVAPMFSMTILWECECGAAVSNKEKHDAWHRTKNV